MDLKELEIHPLEYRVIQGLKFLRKYAEEFRSNIEENSKGSTNIFWQNLNLEDSEIDQQIEDYFKMYGVGEFLNEFGSFYQIAWNSLFVSYYTLEWTPNLRHHK